MQRFELYHKVRRKIEAFHATFLYVQIGFDAFFAGDLLENYCWNDDLMNFARVLFSVSILLTFPIECFVSREVGGGREIYLRIANRCGNFFLSFISSV